ncbi:MAG: beta-1,6-N-acetylglucosaminyltransferase [Bacteroides sp.]|jgi:hypothetical protein|nr:beta-1,6-N-acetylglucosaminyltransferase [Bacteroides sp.]MCI1684048.1 beta-1,6-N-acetylglucosaminyltransferase [Bacteroides sp.]
MKHAYLILAHHEFVVLQRLLSALDDPRNDLYIHFDRKVVHLPLLHLHFAGLYVLDKRIDVRWGDVSVVEAELALFECAYSHERYDYYHLLSGVDMPLRSQDFIHHFFEQHKGKEFIGFYQGNIESAIDRKVRHYHLFPEHFRNGEGGFALLFRYARYGVLRLQYLLGVRRNRHILFKKGTQWVSITNDLVHLVLSQKKDILKTYHHTFCSDEIFLPTICWNSPFRDRLYDDKDEGNGCMRMIGWRDNRLMEWEEKDYDRLMQSNALFARKFSSEHLILIDRILKTILS